MVQMCFVLDLRSLAPPLLTDLKQSLLQLANYYAVPSSPPSGKSATLAYKIGLCYVVKNRLSSSDELKIAYRPTGNFNLRDFPHAVNNLPCDAFVPDFDNKSDVMISNVLSERVLYSWEGRDIERRVIFITSTLPEDVDSTMQKSLMDAADKCVSVDFAVFQQKSSHLTDSRENINNFRRSISHFDNCSVQTYIPDFRIFHGLVKRWLQILKDDMEEPLLARLIFKDNLLGSVNHIFCNLFAPAYPITNSFSQCQTCRCHGIPLGQAEKKLNGVSCPVTGCNLETCDVNENSVRIGEKTILFLPSFHDSLKLLQITSPININVTERINLASLDEGLIMGASFVVIPSPNHVYETTSDDADQSDLNAQLFQGLSSVLHSMDQGLICSSNCDLETMTEAPYHCYYILQPSDRGPMLMRIAERDFSVRISALDIYTKRVKDILNHETDVKLSDDPEPIPSTSRKDKRSLTERQPGRKDKRAKKDKRRKRKRQKKEKNVDIDYSNDDRRVEGKKKALLIAIEYKGVNKAAIIKPDLQEFMKILPHYGFIDMRVLTDTDESYPDPTEVAIKTEAVDIVTNASKGDVILLYYHGHTNLNPPRIVTSDDRNIRAELLWLKVCQSVPRGATLYLMLNCCKAFTHLAYWEREKKNHKGGEVIIFMASETNSVGAGNYMRALAPILREKHGIPISNEDLHNEVEVNMWSHFIHKEIPENPMPNYCFDSPDPRLIISSKMLRKPMFSSMYEDDV